MVMPAIFSVHLSSRSVSPLHSLQRKNTPPGFSTRYTSAKQRGSSGQKYTVSNAVARSNRASSNGSLDTDACKTVQRPASIAFRFTARDFCTLTGA